MAEDAINILNESKPVVNNKVELLRPLERTVGQFDSLVGWPFTDQGAGNDKDGLPCSGADGDYTDIDKEFLENFKKIHHLGTDQLDSFVNDLTTRGQDLDPESLLYYIRQLYNGPLANAQSLRAVAGKKNFKNAPDIMGVVGDHGAVAGAVKIDIARPNSSAPQVLPPDEVNTEGINQLNVTLLPFNPLNASPLTYNKCPKFIQDLLFTNTATVQEVFNSGVQQLRTYDNTLPQIDKFNNYRIENEQATFVRDPNNPQEGKLNADHDPGNPDVPPGWGTEEGDLGNDKGLYAELRALKPAGQNHRAHGNIGVKDVEFFNTLGSVGPAILASVDSFLGREDWELCVFKKTINYFDPVKNTATSKNESISRVLEYIVRKFDDDGEQVTTENVSKETDLFGNAFTSEERMAFELKVPDHKGQGQDGTFKLYTVEGQLGSGKDPKRDKLVTPCKA